MKLPFTFGIKLFFRLFIPGFLLSLGVWPMLRIISDKLLSGVPAFEYIFFLNVILTGWIISLLDMPIYMAFEGRRYWPDCLRKILLKREENRLNKTRKRIAEFKETNRKLYLEASVEIRKFPMDEDGEYIVEFPTRLGNLISAYENYPDRVYGTDAVFYWYRIWLMLDKEIREEIDNRQAITDSAIYASFILYINFVLCLIYAILAVAGIQFFSFLPDVIILLCLSILSLFAAIFVYRISLYSHSEFGEIFKSVFDNFRSKIDISEILDDLIDLTKDSSIKDLAQKDKFRVVWRLLHNYRVMCPKCRKVFSPVNFEEHTCST